MTALRGHGLQLEGEGTELHLALPDESVFDVVRDAAVDTGAGITLLKRESRSLEEVFLAGSPAERAEAADFYRHVGTLGRVFFEIETEAFALPS